MSFASPNFNRDLPACADVSLSCASSADSLCLTLEAADKARRRPLHCIIVLDVSGSMDSPATQTSPDASQEAQLIFTRLDLAKHSSKVIVEVMGDDDMVSLITFGTQAKVNLGSVRTTAEGAAAPCMLHARLLFTRATQANFKFKPPSTRWPATAPPTSSPQADLRSPPRCPTQLAATYTL
jgi:hypothetical protein